MFDNLPRLLTLVAAIGAGISGGVFFAFSTFIMSSLGRLPDRQGLVAMQEVNRGAPNPLFMLALFGTAIVCLVLGVSAVRRLGEPVALWQLAGCALYLVAVLVTIVYHVPRNNLLDVVDPAAANAGQQWRDSFTGWNNWNHVRTVACVGGSQALTVAVRLG
jgi:uncharacterized membrane protein